jgi:hypothetical protein
VRLELADANIHVTTIRQFVTTLRFKTEAGLSRLSPSYATAGRIPQRRCTPR